MRCIKMWLLSTVISSYKYRNGTNQSGHMCYSSKASIALSLYVTAIKKRRELGSIRQELYKDMAALCFRPLLRSLRFCRYDPTIHLSPFIVVHSYLPYEYFPMLLDELFWIQENLDSTFAFRRSCREGICGSCAMNINGINSLACIHQIKHHSASNIVYPLAHLPIIRDLVVSLKHFYSQYKSIQPWMHLNSSEMHSVKQYPIQRSLLDGLYECILCACCSTSCPSYWWNSDNYLGPAILLQALRWIVDSRDVRTLDRISTLNDSFKLYRCHSIMNCAQCCPKGLNPALAIAAIKRLVVNTVRLNSML